MQGKRLLERFTAVADLASRSMPGLPVLELTGENRVLIENHQGVTGYSDVMICVKVQYGCLEINGCQLSLAYMSDEKLIITGIIHEIKLLHRG